MCSRQQGFRKFANVAGMRSTTVTFSSDEARVGWADFALQMSHLFNQLFQNHEEM
jgi:hypothetical protein